MASLAHSATRTHSSPALPAEIGSAKEAEATSGNHDPDAALLMSMDREVQKYEQLTQMNSMLEKKMNSSSGGGGRVAKAPATADSNSK